MEKNNKITAAIGVYNFFAGLAKDHDVAIDSLNIHICRGDIYIAEYTPGSENMFRHLEIITRDTLSNSELYSLLPPENPEGPCRD